MNESSVNLEARRPKDPSYWKALEKGLEPQYLYP